MLRAGRLTGGRMAVYVKKFEILQKETVNSSVLSDCVPVIMDLVTCELNVDKVLRQSLLRSLVQSKFLLARTTAVVLILNACYITSVVVSSETVVEKLSALWRTDLLMRDLLRVMREHVMTQYKHYQLYMHNMVTVMKRLVRVMWVVIT